MRRPKILLTNDDGWDAPGLAALVELASPLGEVFVVAPRDPHSYAGHRVTTDAPLVLTETAEGMYHLSGTPADCVRVALTAILPDIDWVLSGINRGGNLGADIYSSGTVAAAREAALLGKPAVAVSQYVRRGLELDWKTSSALASPVICEIMAGTPRAGEYWNINLPHLDPGSEAEVAECAPDAEPLDVRFEREGDRFHFRGSYAGRPRRAGLDVDRCFGGAITVSRLQLSGLGLP